MLIQKFKISLFKNKNLSPQFGVGVSFDFEKIVHLINEKSRQNVFRAELAVCSISNESVSPTSAANQAATTSSTYIQLSSSPPPLKTTAANKSIAKRRSVQQQTNANNANAHVNTNVLIQQELRNRMLLYKYFSMLNKNFNICTHLIHGKFSVTILRREFNGRN